MRSSVLMPFNLSFLLDHSAHNVLEKVGELFHGTLAVTRQVWRVGDIHL